MVRKIRFQSKKHLKNSNKTFTVEHYFYFFLSGFSFTDTDDSQDSRGREGTIFYSTLPLPPVHEHSDIYLQLCMWDDYHIFNRNACIYQAPCYSMISYLLIELPFHWLIMWSLFKSLFTWWFDTRFLLQQSWYKKPVDSNAYRVLPLYYKRTDQPILPVHYFA